MADARTQALVGMAKHLIQVAKLPKAFPMKRPVGPTRMLEEPPPWTELPREHEVPVSPETAENLISDRWMVLTRCLEEQLCDIHDLYDGHERCKKHIGRAKGPTFIWMPALPQRNKEFAATSVLARALAKLSQHLDGIQTCVRSRMAKRWAFASLHERRLRAQLLVPKGLLKRALTSQQAEEIKWQVVEASSD